MSLASFIGELPSMVFSIAAKGALISLAALGVATVLRRASAASRHLVLALAAAALVMLPLMTVILPSWELAVLPRSEPPAFSQGHPSGTEARLVAVGPELSSSSMGEVVPAPGSHLDMRALLPLLPPAVSLLLLLPLGAAVYRLTRLRTGSRPAPAEWQELFGELQRGLGIARPVCLAMSGSVTVPVTFGWWRPVVLLPEAARGWAEQPLREALVHELSHVRRGDWPVQIMARAACALHWFDPFVWWLCRRLLLEAELACDDQVLRTGTGAAGYAERLVALARQARETSHHPASAVAFARPSGLASRVTALLDSGRRRGRPGRLAVAAAACAALILLLLMAPARLVQAASASRAEIRSLEQKIRATSSTFPVSSLPPLLRASWEGNLAEVRRLLASGADPDQAVPRAGTPLILAATQGHREVVEALLAAGADPALAEKAGERPADLQRTPLGAAARQGDLEVVRRLLAAGAPVDLAPRGDATPLMNAAERGRREVVEALLDAGADPKAVIRGDGTPLIAAARGGDVDVVRRLLQAGADPDIYVPGDETALQQAIENGHAEAARVLLEAGATPLTDEALEDAVEQGVSDGAREGVNEDSIRDGVREGIDEGVPEALPTDVKPNNSKPGDGKPLTAASRQYAELLHRMLAGSFFEPVGPKGEGC